MNRLGAAKVNTAHGTVWCHLSESEKKRKLRRYDGEMVFEIDADGADIDVFVPLAECQQLVPAKSHAFSEIAVWTEIFRQLEGREGKDSGISTVSLPARQITVPITHLRRFYESLKLFDEATLKNLAEFYSRSTDSLERLWRLSRQAFSAYENLDGWGQSKREPLPQPPKSLRFVTTTDEFTAFIKEGTFGTEDAKFGFVDREINPRRTKQAVFSDKLPATRSGRGGMDLLLRSYGTGFPTVGEVKVKKDKNAFYALVQAMCYAVELSTIAQLRRLKKHFAAFNDLNVDEGKVEIVVLLVNPTKDPTRQAVSETILKLNNRRKCGGLATILMLENIGDSWKTIS